MGKIEHETNRKEKEECKIERQSSDRKARKDENHSNNKNKSTSQNVSEWRRERQR